MKDWQPISTAPKDGTWMLVYAPAEIMEDGITMVHWDDLLEQWRDMSDSSDELTPTHWMPLPDPPEPQS